MTSHNRTTLYMLTLKEVMKRTGLSRSTVYNKLNPRGKYFDPTFPRPVRLRSSPAIRFIESELDLWLQQCVDASRESDTDLKQACASQLSNQSMVTMSGEL
jgi:prophage regulatory protein